MGIRPCGSLSQAHDAAPRGLPLVSYFICCALSRPCRRTGLDGLSAWGRVYLCSASAGVWFHFPGPHEVSHHGETPSSPR